MESEAKRRSRGPRSAPFLRFTVPSKGTPKKTTWASWGERVQAMKRGETGLMDPGPLAVPAARPLDRLEDVLFGQEHDRRHRAADALHPVLGGKHLPLPAGLPADPEGLLQHLASPPRLTFRTRSLCCAACAPDRRRRPQQGVADRGR